MESYDSDVFELLVTSRGAGTRINMLRALHEPKDRLQLARELGLSWRAIDRHMGILKAHELVNTQIAYGRVKVYSASVIGTRVLSLVRGI
jgi:DNA-binding transcriptional ArsR family regulator